MVLSNTEAGVFTLTLNRPEAANAIGPEQRNLIIDMLHVAGSSPDVRVVVIRANGRQFCAGADVSRIGTDSQAAERRAGDITHTLLEGAQRLIAAILDCRKPVVAAVQGAAAGLGAHLAYACDLIVASEEASFIESFVLRGLVVDAGGSYLLPRRIGMQKAKELAFFGDRLSAVDALALGLVNRVVNAAELDSTVHAFASRLAMAPTTAVSLTKELFNRSLDAERATSFMQEAMAQELNSATHDSKEGVSAFLARRPPNFKGY